MQIFTCKTLEETKELAKKVAHSLGKKRVILLWADMGVGKTAFCKACISALSGIDENQITSPTFPIICTYESKFGQLVHMDLYRVSSDDLIELGTDELLNNNICLVEWPDRIKNPPRDCINIYITQTTEGYREYKII